MIKISAYQKYNWIQLHCVRLTLSFDGTVVYWHARIIVDRATRTAVSSFVRVLLDCKLKPELCHFVVSLEKYFLVLTPCKKFSTRNPAVFLCLG